jgi:Thioredoxin like C-terminal domain
LGPEAQADWANLESPETYLGQRRTTGFDFIGHTKAPELPPTLELNHWAMSGDWTIQTKSIVLNEAGGRIAMEFHARDVNLVMGLSTRGATVRFQVLLDGEAPGDASGEDVDGTGDGVVAEQRMHLLLRQPGPIVDRRFEIEFLDPGAEAFVFTFG